MSIQISGLPFSTLFLLSVMFLISVSGCGQTEVESERYLAIKGRDTAELKLTRYDTRFFGQLIIRKPGFVVDSGEVRGKIKQNILVGDYHYVPFGAKHAKRKGFALLDSAGYLIRGYGKQEVYMGIPYYVEGSITFPQDGFIFQKIPPGEPRL